MQGLCKSLAGHLNQKTFKHTGNGGAHTCKYHCKSGSMVRQGALGEKLKQSQVILCKKWRVLTYAAEGVPYCPELMLLRMLPQSKVLMALV